MFLMIFSVTVVWDVCLFVQTYGLKVKNSSMVEMCTFVCSVQDGSAAETAGLTAGEQVFRFLFCYSLHPFDLTLFTCYFIYQPKPHLHLTQRMYCSLLFSWTFMFCQA